MNVCLIGDIGGDHLSEHKQAGAVSGLVRGVQPPLTSELEQKSRADLEHHFIQELNQKKQAC